MNEKKPHNAADEEADKASQEAQRVEREQELNDIRYLLSTPSGIRFFRRIMAKFGLFRNAMTGNSNTFFHLGEQNVTQWLLTEVTLTASAEQLASVMFDFEERAKNGS